MGGSVHACSEIVTVPCMLTCVWCGVLSQFPVTSFHSYSTDSFEQHTDSFSSDKTEAQHFLESAPSYSGVSTLGAWLFPASCPAQSTRVRQATMQAFAGGNVKARGRERAGNWQCMALRAWAWAPGMTGNVPRRCIPDTASDKNFLILFPTFSLSAHLIKL